MRMELGVVSISMVGALVSLAAASPQEAIAHSHLSPAEREAVDRTIERGLGWLRARQGEDGAWRPARRTGISPVALSSMVLWASAECGAREEGSESCERGARFLLANRRADGGIYDEGRGLRVYTSGVAARALEAEHARTGAPELLAAAREVGLYAYRRGIPESFVDDQVVLQTPGGDQRERAEEILAATPSLAGGERRALEFLARHAPGVDAAPPPQRARDPRWQAPGPEEEALSYEDVLPLVYAELRPEQQLSRRAHHALRRFYTLEENPDLTRRWTRSGFHHPEQGLYYYYLGAARVLDAFATPRLVLEDESEHDWPRELSRKLIKLQREDGSWVNENARWWEGEPALTTAYALLALRLCRDAPPDPTRRSD